MSSYQRRRSTGGNLDKKGTAGVSWPLLITYALAALGGAMLVLGLVRFNALHQEFISANFDSVHGARTLLKARLLLEVSANELDLSAPQPEATANALRNAEKRLRNAEHYTAEGRDTDDSVRSALVERIGLARGEVARLQAAPPDAGRQPRIQELSRSLLRLSRDVDAAELDRWGTLSGLNKELEARMRTMNQLLTATVILFIGVMGVLAWALLRTRRAEADLQAAKHAVEAIQQTTLDASPIGIAIIDTSDPENSRLQVVNRQMASIFGYEPEAMPGVSTRRLFSGSDSYRRLSTDAPAHLQTGAVLREELVMQRRNGMPFWCALSIKAIDANDIRRGVIWTCEDIGERKAAESELQQERTRAEAASRAKSDFLANISHELRTPFTGLFGLLDLLDHSRLGEVQRRYVTLARSSAEQMQSIVNDILDFSKIEAGKLIIERVPFRLRELIAGIADMHCSMAQRKDLSFRLEIEEPLAEVLCGDPVRIRQIVDNLLGNAVKFTNHGEIRLIVQTQAGSDGTAALRITVEDTGVGIPAEMQPKIFEKFTQADSSTTRMYGGTGLGLAICRQLAALMGGTISLSSREGRGSRFTLDVRLQLGDPDLLAEQAAAPEARIDGVTIVLAEDNDVNRDVMAETLELFGAVVWTASNGEEAIAMVGEHRPDIVLMDCQMPGMDGLEATRRIRAAEAGGPRLPIIAISAYATSNYRDECLAPGMMDRFLAKPLNTAHLLAVIRDQLKPVANTENPGKPLSGHILLVEDNLPILESTRAMLARAGCEVTTAMDGSSALHLLEATVSGHGHEFDLVLMDCQLPILDGRETARRWRAYEKAHQLPPLAIIAMTADDRRETLAECREAGMQGTLLKPYGEEDLLALLADWLR